MRRFAATAVVLVAMAASLIGCGSEPANPERLWLYLDGRETEVKLVDSEPPPF